MYQTVKRLEVPLSTIRRLVQGLGGVLKVNGSVSIHFIGDRRMRQLNHSFRRIDRTTDVLAFPTREGEGKFMGVTSGDIGDIFISVPQIRRQAQSYHRPYQEELARMLIHGMLHLLGYDHDTPAKEKIMFGLQEKFVRRFL